MRNYWDKTKYAFQTFHRAYGSYHRAVVTLILLGFLGGFLEGIGVNALIPLLSFFIAKEEIAGSDFVSQWIERGFNFFHIDFDLLPLLILVVTLFIFKAAVTFWFNYLKIKIRANYEQQIRSNLFSKTLATNWPNLTKQKIGYLETVLVVDVRGGAELIETISNSVMAMTNLLAYLIIALNISFSFTIITLVVGGLMFLLIKPILYRIRKIIQSTAALNKQVSHFINEHIIGLRTVKVLGQERAVTNRATILFQQLKNYQISTLSLRNLISALMQPISVTYISVAIGLIYYYGQKPNIGALIALVYLIDRIFSYIQSLQSNLSQIHTSLPYLEEVLLYTRRAEAGKEVAWGTRDFQFSRELAVTNLDFAYEATTVLTKVNFQIQRGAMVGLIGFSGAGKTTIFDLLLRLLKPQAGSITVDGVNINEIKLTDWRKNIGYVSQDIFLLNDTILNNIKFYDDSITEGQAKRAAQQAQIHAFIESLPEKYQTIVGERGIRLSVGQRQRIAIARILARQPSLLLLDEATSALDNESEVAIQQAIEKLKGETTVLVIAHRLSTVLNCDRLLVLDQGQIIEQGQPAALLKNHDSHFYKLYNIRQQ